jgi:hypothetical protein
MAQYLAHDSLATPDNQDSAGTQEAMPADPITPAGSAGLVTPADGL